MTRPSSETHNLSLPYQQVTQPYDRITGAPLPITKTDYTRTDVWAVNGRTSNKVRTLSSGTIWKPCSSYSRYSMSFDESGSCISQWQKGKGNPRPGEISSVITGYSGAFPVITNDPVIEATGVPKAVPSNTKIRCGTELMLRVQSRKASIGEQLSQLHKDAEDLGKVASDLLRATLALRHGKFGQAAHILGLKPKEILSLKSPAERWLQIQYGFMPLANDLVDIHDLFQKGLRKTTPLMHSVREIKDSGYAEAHLGGGGGPQLITMNWESRYKMKVWYSVEPSWLATLSQLGLSNPAQIAWDLVPYSFVVDWLVPVGNFLQALDARAGVTFIDGYGVYRVKSRRTFNVKGGPGYYDEVRSDDRKVISTNSGYSRTKLTGFPVPGIYFKNPFSSKHVTSALALFRQLIR